MESSKKKVVTKVIIKNILAWVCTLCMVFCVIPSNARADGEVEGEVTDTETDTKDTETVGTVSITLNLDGSTWAGQTVTLGKSEGSLPCEYKDGVYAATSVPLDEAVQVQVNGKDTGVSATLTAEQQTVTQTINYYSVSFKDADGADFGDSQIVLSGSQASRPDTSPEKEDVVFDQWVTAQDGGDVFDFTSSITATTVLYPSWKLAEVPGHDHEWDEEWSSNEAAHWHECVLEDCPIEWNADTIEAADGYALHDFEVITAETTKAPTCTEAGWEVLRCKECGYRTGKSVDALGHDFDTEVWESDDIYHWHACKNENCDERAAVAEHRENRGIITKRPTTEAEGERTYTCEICDKTRVVAIPALEAPHESESDHDFHDEWIYDGENHWHECDCGGRKDEAAHDYDTEEWKHDSDSHWYECACGLRKDEAEHTWDAGEVTVEPTVTTDGEKTYTCTECEETKTEVIPKTEPSGDAGEIILDPIEQGSNTPTVKLTTELNELADAILTSDEKAHFMNGDDLKIELTVENISRTIEEPTKNVINQFVSPYHYQVGQYLDIKMYKTITADAAIGRVRSRISETNDVIRICIAVPDALKDTTGSKGRTYAIVRLHNNVPMILNDLDSDANTITLETDRFSTYAIIYRDTADANGNDNNNNGNNGNNTGNNGNNTGNNGSTGNNGGTSNNGNNGNTGNNGSSNTSDGSTIVNNNITITNSSNTGTNRNVPKTGDTSPIGMYVTIAILSGFAYLLLLFTDKQRRMSEAEKNELIASLSAWARKRGITAKCFAGFSIACILFYYHTVGKRVKAAVKECM